MQKKENRSISFKKPSDLKEQKLFERLLNDGAVGAAVGGCKFRSDVGYSIIRAKNTVGRNTESACACLSYACCRSDRNGIDDESARRVGVVGKRSE